MADQNLSEAEIERQLVRDYPLFFLEMNEMQDRFVRVKNSKGKTPRRRLNECGNKSGKTHLGLAEDLAHSWGYRPWLDEDDPDYKVEIKVPNIGLIGCETMMHSVMGKIWPTLKDLIPKTCRYKAKKNPQGQIQRISFETNPHGEKCESVIYLRSYDQDDDTFEGIDTDWVHWDEPPPKKILQAAERGKVVTNAPSWFTMTPLKEAYIYDEYSLKAANMGGDDDEIAVTRGLIWENCADWCFFCDLDIPENSELDPETHELLRPVKSCPNCNRKTGFILKAGIDEYLKTLDPEEREAREKGLWKHLSGLVYKSLSRERHVCDDFQIPRTWMKVEGIDPHDAKPTRYLFAAVSPEEIEIHGKLRNRIYVYDYLTVKGGDLDGLVRKIKMKREQHGYSKPKWIVLDAKYGRRKEMENRTWEDELIRRGLGNIRLSQSKPGDVEIGHKKTREYLLDKYSLLTGDSKPGIMFLRRCMGDGGPVHQMFNYQYQEKVDKPDDQFKDFPDIIRYMALEEPIYMSPEHMLAMDNALKNRMEKATSMRRRRGAAA